MAQDDDARFYIYQLNMNGHEQTGLVGCCAIDDYFNNPDNYSSPAAFEEEKNYKKVLVA